MNTTLQMTLALRAARDAMAVIAKDRATSDWLERNDPKGLEQLNGALAQAEAALEARRHELATGAATVDEVQACLTAREWKTIVRALPEWARYTATRADLIDQCCRGAGCVVPLVEPEEIEALRQKMVRLGRVI